VTTNALSGEGGSEAQLWKFTTVKFGPATYYHIILKETGRCLAKVSNANDTIVTRPCSTDDDGNHWYQLWGQHEPTGAPANHYAFGIVGGSGKYLYRDTSGDMITKAGTEATLDSDKGYWFETSALPKDKESDDGSVYSAGSALVQLGDLVQFGSQNDWLRSGQIIEEFL
jgi:hypothetical protein